MALVTEFKFTNTNLTQNKVTAVDLELVTNYALASETQNSAVLSNKTTPIDSQEIVSFRSKDIDRVNNKLTIRNPAPVKSGIQYGVQIEETLTTTDTEDPTFRMDEPIVISINIRHPKSGNFSNSIVGQAMTRAISTLLKSDGTWRFDDLMRSAERPVVN